MTAEMNRTNTKLLSNLQLAKKNFEVSLRKAAPVEEAVSQGNLKKSGAIFRSRVERIHTEIQKDSFYKNLGEFNRTQVRTEIKDDASV